MTSLWPQCIAIQGTRCPPVMGAIAAAVALQHGVTVEDLRGQARTQKIAHARFHAFWECRKYQHLSLTKIGRFFGDRDHTTVLHGLKRHEELRQG